MQINPLINVDLKSKPAPGIPLAVWSDNHDDGVHIRRTRNGYSARTGYCNFAFDNLSDLTVFIRNHFIGS